MLRDLQEGEILEMPESRPLPVIGARCHELRIWDGKASVFWRIIYRADHDAIIIVVIFAKKTQKMPVSMIELCINRLKSYDMESKKG